jgi:dolichyl-phosphate-mannose--protein O-mannosyl transferase
MFKNRFALLFSIVIILLFSYLVTFRNYEYPAAMYWDENYHLASAYKYTHNVFFQEMHPPLGKLFIALGEKLFHPNDNLNTTYFLSTDYIKSVPEGFSFVGVRFFPILFAFLCPVIFFLILYSISKRILLSSLFSFVYLFNNALVVHYRGAMLDAIQMFFILCAILIFTYSFMRKDNFYYDILIGVFVGLSYSVKVNGLIIILLPLFILLWRCYIKKVKLGIMRFMVSLMSSLLIVLLVFYIHFSLATNIHEGREYNLDGSYLDALYLHKLSSKYFFTSIISYYKYSEDYNRHVPQLNLCKEDENGSYPLSWLVGSKAINYRWEQKGSNIRYLYLVPNPVVWLIGLCGIFLSLILIGSRIFFNLKIKNNYLFNLIIALSITYLSYMFMMLQVNRVLYLYHYFIPLVISLILFYIQFIYLFERQLNNDKYVVYIVMFIIVTLVLVLFIFYSPLTYYIPLSTTEFLHRATFSFWHMKPIILMTP